MAFGSLSLFPEEEYRERRIAPLRERRAPARRRESEYQEDRHEHHTNMAEVMGTVVVGAIGLGILGGMMNK